MMTVVSFAIRVLERFARFITAMCGHLVMRASGAQLGSNLRLYGIPIVSRSRGAAICIGDRVVLCSDSRYTALGVNHPVILRAMRPGATIVVGNDVGMSGATLCAMTRVIIGDQTMLGANVTIADTDFHSLNPDGRRHSQEGVATAPVTIGRNVFIGMNSVVLKGVTIGDNSVIGANSLVTRDIPADVIAAGNPCRMIRSLRDCVFQAVEVAE